MFYDAIKLSHTHKYIFIKYKYVVEFYVSCRSEIFTHILCNPINFGPALCKRLAAAAQVERLT